MFPSVGSAVGLQDKVRFKDQMVENISLVEITAEDLGTWKTIYAGSICQNKGRQQ